MTICLRSKTAAPPGPLRRISFASCYVYSPGGAGAACERSRLLRDLLKDADARFLVKYAGRVKQQVAEPTRLAGFVGPEHVLVPVPGSARSSPRQVSVTERLAGALVNAGVGQGIWNGLRRMRSVCKSATAGPGRRPTVAAHYESFAVDSSAVSPRQLLLVDDVVTKGRTLFAAAARLHEAFPGAEIRAFALVRTLGFAPDVGHVLEPCIGEIRWWAGDAHRSP